jgi:putative transposase
MSNYRRARTAGARYFFTVVTYNRKPLFNCELARLILHQAFVDVRKRNFFKIEALCLLPDHLHTIWKLPENDSAYPQRWNQIKGIFTKQFRDNSLIDESISGSRLRKREGAIWQRRYWEHLIRDEQDYSNHMDYIHYNPVKHGLVEQVVDWPWSSFHKYMRAGVYAADWSGSSPAKTNLNTAGE